MTPSYWDKHIESALLGVARSGWSPDNLPDRVKAFLPDNKDTATAFLDATALLNAYAKGGMRTTETIEEPIGEAPEDPLPFCNAAAINLWREIRMLECNHYVLEKRWLDLCHRSRHVLAPDLLVDILQLGVKKNNAGLRPLIAKVAGARGRWLAGFFPDWAYLELYDVRRIWAEGKTTERVAVFAHARKDHPAAALQLLESTWEKESAADRKKLLEVLLINLSESDLPFLEKIKSEYSQMTGTGKAAVLDLKKWITRLLLKIPEAPLRKIWTTALSHYFQSDSTGRLAFVLPDDGDDFFCHQHLTQEAGFTKFNNDAAGVIAWFHELLAWIQPVIWMEAAGATPENTLLSFQADAKIRNLLIQAALENNDPSLAEVLMEYATGDNWQKLLGVLPEPRREQIIMSQPAYADKANWQSPELHFHWSPEFSRFVLQRLYDSWIGYYFHRIQQIMPLDVYLHPSVKPAEIPGLYDPMNKRETWLQTIVPELEKTLKVKKKVFEI